jgi:hypothetical protein
MRAFFDRVLFVLYWKTWAARYSRLEATASTETVVVMAMLAHWSELYFRHVLFAPVSHPVGCSSL